jgi:hypothetical protein
LGDKVEEKLREQKKSLNTTGLQSAAITPPAVYRAKQFYKQAIKMCCGIRVAPRNNDHSKDDNWLYV